MRFTVVSRCRLRQWEARETCSPPVRVERCLIGVDAAVLHTIDEHVEEVVRYFDQVKPYHGGFFN
jgi:hypothetical protein